MEVLQEIPLIRLASQEQSILCPPKKHRLHQDLRRKLGSPLRISLCLCPWLRKYLHHQYRSAGIIPFQRQTSSITTRLSRPTSSTPISSLTASNSQYGRIHTLCPGRRVGEIPMAWLSATRSAASSLSVQTVRNHSTLSRRSGFRTSHFLRQI